MRTKLLKNAEIKPVCPNCEIENNKNVPNTKIGVNVFSLHLVSSSSELQLFQTLMLFLLLPPDVFSLLDSTSERNSIGYKTSTIAPTP